MKKYLLLCLVILACQNQQPQSQSQENNTNTPKENQKKTILFFGNSLTAGYGLDIFEAFPSLIQQKIDSLQLPYQIQNAGLSGETTAGGKARVDWLLKNPVDIFVLELGANDGLRGITLSETRNNLNEIIQKVKNHNPQVKILLAGMQVPPNMGARYTNEFRSIFPELAKEHQITLIPFLLEGVAAQPELNLPDGIHPNKEGQKIVAQTVWKYLEKLL